MSLIISPQVVSLTGTTDEIVASSPNGAVTVSLPDHILIASVFPASDSTTAIQIRKAGAGGTGAAVLTADTTNSNIGIGTTPNSLYKLHTESTLATANSVAGYFRKSGAVSGTSYGIFSTISGASTSNIGGYFVSTGATNNYNIYSGTLAAGAANWSIYSVAAAQSYIEGSLNIGYTLPLQVASTGSPTKVTITGLTNNIVQHIKSYANTTALPMLTFGKSRGTSLGSEVATSSGDYFGAIYAEGVNSSNATAVGTYLWFRQDGAGGATYIPGRFEFYTGTNAAAPTEKFRIDSTGTVKILTYTTNGIVRTTGGDGTLSSTGGAISLTSEVTGVLPVTNGGTNASSASITAFNNITGYTASGATGTTSTNLVFSASPTFTGVPAAPTASPGTNTTQIATTAFVTAAVGSSTGSVITDDSTTNATMYPTWVTANTGSLPLKVSSTKFGFNPANTTGTTTSGSLFLNASTLTTGDGLYVVSSTLTTGNLVNIAVTGTAAGANQYALNISMSGANATSTITTAAANISNTHTGTSSTNIGLQLTASGATNNYALITTAGLVGLGTSTPTKALDIVAADNAEAQIRLYKGANLVTVLGTGSSAPGVEAGWLVLYNDSAAEGIRLYTQGDSWITGGNLGIGTVSPGSNYKVHIVDTSTTAGSRGLHILKSGIVAGDSYGIVSLVNGASTSNYGAYLSATSATNNYALVVPSGGGRVGIGTSTPIAQLVVKNVSITGGNPTTSGTTDANILTRFEYNTAVMDIGVYSSGHQWIQLRNNTNHATNYNLSLNPNGGNIAIGQNTASYKLDILSTTPNDRGIFATVTATSGTNYGGVFQVNGSGATENIGAHFVASNGTTNKHIQLQTLAAATNNYSIYSVALAKSYFAGAIAIGSNTVPTSLLHVEGTTNGNQGIYTRNLSTNSAAANVLVLGNNTSATQGQIFLNSSANTTYAGANSLNIYNTSTNPIGLYTNNLPRLIVAGNGNVGIGNNYTPTALVHITQTATATGALKGFLYTGAVNTNQTTATEISSIEINTAGRQWATGAITTQREVLITAPTYSFVGASTITDAATVGIAGAPIESTNATLTNTHGLLIQAGAVGSATNSYGLTVNAQTGATNNYAAQFLGGAVNIAGTTAGQVLFNIQGTSGQLFSVVDNMTGSLMAVNDISGLPILEVFSDDTILMGSYLAPTLTTTVKKTVAVGSTIIYSLPFATYTAGFFDYTASDGTNKRTGSIMYVCDGTSITSTETFTMDIGSTSNLRFTVTISGSDAVLTAVSASGTWTIKTIVRSI